MKGILGFFGAFCVTSVAIAALFILVPDGKFTKPLKYTFCICFLCLVFSSVSVTFRRSEISVPSTDAADFSYASEAALKLTFKTALGKAGISFSDLDIITSKNTDGGIDIIEVTVWSPDDPQKIIDAIGNEDYEVNVINDQNTG